MIKKPKGFNKLDDKLEDTAFALAIGLRIIYEIYEQRKNGN